MIFLSEQITVLFLITKSFSPNRTKLSYFQGEEKEEKKERKKERKKE